MSDRIDKELEGFRESENEAKRQGDRPNLIMMQSPRLWGDLKLEVKLSCSPEI